MYIDKITLKNFSLDTIHGSLPWSRYIRLNIMIWEISPGLFRDHIYKTLCSKRSTQVIAIVHIIFQHVASSVWNWMVQHSGVSAGLQSSPISTDDATCWKIICRIALIWVVLFGHRVLNRYTVSEKAWRNLSNHNVGITLT